MLSKLNQQVQIYSDKKYSFITGNGTSAIYLALQSSGLPKGSKIVVPNISCPDPVYALIWAGYKPVFVDVNTADYNMDITKLEQALKADKQIKAIIAIHLFGNACDIVSIQMLAKEYDCFLLEDCAQAFGNEIDEGKLGSFGDVSIFSFGNGKILEVGHGGSIQTNDKKLFKKIKIEYRKLDNYNEHKLEKLSKWHRKIYYKLYYLGLKYSIFNILNLIYVYFFQSYYLYKVEEKKVCFISSALEDFEVNKKSRIDRVNMYKERLKGKVYFPIFNNQETILSRLTVTVNKAEKLSKKIRDNGVSSNTMYPMLVDRFTIFFNKEEYRNSYKLKGRLLNLWLTDISEKDLTLSIKIIKDINE